MPLEATLLFSWTWIYAFTAVIYLLVFAQRRVELEFTHFAYSCVCFAIMAYAEAQEILAESPEERLFAARLFVASVCALGASFTAFTARLVGRPTRLVPLAALLAGVAVATSFVGVAVQQDDDGSLSLHPLLILVFASGFAVTATAAVRTLRRQWHDRHTRWIIYAATLGIFATANDVFALISGEPRQDALVHVGLIGVLAVHWMLLARFGDVTDKLEKKRAAYAASLDDLTRKHAELLETELLATVGELSAVIAHEVRNPLAIIKNAVAALKRSKDAGAQQKLLSILDEETERLHRLTFQLGAYAELGKPSYSECPLRHIFERCAERALAPHEGDAPLDVSFDLTTEVATLQADPELLESAIAYLIQNAIDASPDGGVISLSASETSFEGVPAVELVVRDRGEGMSAEILGKATSPFFTTRPRGTGLALSIVQRIAQSHGGAFMMESEPGVGTSAHLIIPAERSSIVPQAPAPAPAPPILALPSKAPA